MSHENRLDERLGDDEALSDDLDGVEPNDDDVEELGEDEAIDTDDFESDIEDLDDDDEEFEIADEALTQKEQNARSLAVRRAIEQRMEQKKLEDDLDYLDLDLDE